MNVIRYLLLAWGLIVSGVQGDESRLPPKEVRGAWAELDKRGFQEWGIGEFLGWDVPLDGGSRVFSFKSGENRSFSVVVANRAYWTDEEKEGETQVVYLNCNGRFYKVEQESAEEAALIKWLNKASEKLTGKRKQDPKLLKGLAEVLTTRKPIFGPNKG